MYICMFVCMFMHICIYVDGYMYVYPAKTNLSLLPLKTH